MSLGVVQGDRTGHRQTERERGDEDGGEKEGPSLLRGGSSGS